MCETCKYRENDHDKKPCSICYHWVDGYLTATQYKSVYKINKRK